MDISTTNQAVNLKTCTKLWQTNLNPNKLLMKPSCLWWTSPLRPQSLQGWLDWSDSKSFQSQVRAKQVFWTPKSTKHIQRAMKRSLHVTPHQTNHENHWFSMGFKPNSSTVHGMIVLENQWWGVIIFMEPLKISCSAKKNRGYIIPQSPSGCFSSSGATTAMSAAGGAWTSAAAGSGSGIWTPGSTPRCTATFGRAKGSREARFETGGEGWKRETVFCHMKYNGQ